MLTVFLASALLFQAPAWEVASVQVKGGSRFRPEVIAAAAGLKKGSRAGKTELDAACQKLVVTGIFQNCNYRYMPVSDRAIAVEVQVREAPANHTARIAFPNVDEQKVWAWMAENEPIVTREMPGSDDANRFYAGAIERYMKTLGGTATLTSVIDSDQEGRISIVFRPGDLPAICDVKFTGNALYANKQLRDTLMAVAGNVPYTEMEFRRLLELNIRPLYEEAGRLGVTFPSITATPSDGGVVVHTAVSEGPVYVFKDVSFAGEGIDRTALAAAAQLPIGKVANWRRLTSGLDTATDLLKAQGYLEAKYVIDRRLDEKAAAALVQVTFVPGEQYTFGSLRIEGVPPEVEQKIRGMWRLPSGAPLNEAYVGEYLRESFQVVGSDFRRVSRGMSVRPGTRVVDVTATFAK